MKEPGWLRMEKIDMDFVTNNEIENYFCLLWLDSVIDTRALARARRIVTVTVFLISNC